MNIQELKLKSSEQLITQAEELGIENASTLRKQEILFAILKKVAEKEEITGAGVLQLLQDGFGFLRAHQRASGASSGKRVTTPASATAAPSQRAAAERRCARSEQSSRACL